MKLTKLLCLGFLLIFILPQTLFSQAPSGVNYQAIVRGPLGFPLTNQSVDVRFTIHQGSPTGTPVFQELHTTNTNQFGLINLELGSVNNAAFSVINWGTGGAYYLQIEVDAGSGFDNLGASQLLSVPYALFAKSAATGQQGFNSLVDTASAGAQCPNGGYRVLLGLDTNANTVLDPPEVTSSFVVCNGSNGAANVSDTSATNELQTLSISNDTIFLSSGGFVVLPALGGDNDWVVNGVDMHTDPNITGHVGIGTNVPQKKLHIESSFAGGDGVLINNTTATGNPGLEFQTQGTSRYVMGVDQTDNNKFKIGTTGVNVNTRFTINNLGQVGVGTINPQYQLMVASPDSIVANFIGASPSASAISVVGLNPAAKVGAVLLAGADTGYLVLDPVSKQLFLSNAMTGGHTLLYADSTTALYGLQVANIASDMVYNKSNRIYNETDSIFNYSLSGTIVHANQGMFLTDSLYILGNNKDSTNWVLTNDGQGQAIWTNPSTLGGGGLWQPAGLDAYYNTGNIGIGTSTPGALLDVGPSTNPLTVRATNTNTTSGIAGYFNNTSLTNTSEALAVKVVNPSAPAATFTGGSVGIGTTMPLVDLHVANDTQTTIAIQASHNLAADRAGTLALVRSRGTIAGPTNVVAGDRLGKVEFIGWNSGSNQFEEVASMRALADESYTGGATGSHLEFYVNPMGQGNMIEALRINENGNIGVGTSAPLQLLTLSTPGSTTFRMERTNASAFDWEINVDNLGFHLKGGADGSGPGLTDFVNVDGFGKMGIGTTTPSSLLHILYSGTNVEGQIIDYTATSAAGTSTGIYVSANKTGGGTIVGGTYVISGSATAAEAISLEAQNVAAATANFGVRASVGGPGTTNYGIYSEVNGGTTNWAGYFADGNVFVGDTLVIPTNAGSGKVLTSDAAGNATWRGPVVFKGVFSPFGATAINATAQAVGGTANYSGALVHNTATVPFGGNQNIANMRFRAPEDGFYNIHGSVYVSINALQTVTVEIFNLTSNTVLMSSVMRNPDATQQMFHSINVSTLEMLSQSDDVVLRVYGTAGAGFIVSSTIYNTFEVSMIK